MRSWAAFVDLTLPLYFLYSNKYTTILIEEDFQMPTPMLAAIAWDIQTSAEQFAGTDNKIVCEVLRDDAKIFTVILEAGNTTRLDRGLVDALVYHFTRPFLVFPTEESLSGGVIGIEFPNGFAGHLKMRLRNTGDDLWIKETINVYGRVGELHRDDEGGALLVFDERNQWVDLGSFTKRKVLSTDPSEGTTTLTLLF